MIAANLPALQVALPLVAAPFCVIVGHARFAWLLALAVSWAAFAIALGLTWQVMDSGPISYALGGWPPPWGIEYVIDAANAFVLVVVSGIGAVVMLFARTSVEREIGPNRQHLFYCAYILCLTGLLGITTTGDAFNVFVFLEISSLSTYALIAMGRDRRALTAAFQYLIMGTIGATFILIAIGLLYMMTGTLNMADLQERLPDALGSRPIVAAAAFFTVGVALKAAVFPLHLWLPNAYAYAPSVVSTFLAATATKVSIYVLIRFSLGLFGKDLAFEGLQISWVLLLASVLAMFVGSSVAIYQQDAKRMLAYSSVAQIGYIVIGVSLATSASLTAAYMHIFNHALMKGALFLALGCIFYRIASTRFEDMAGLGRAMPWTCAAFVIGGLSLIGVPLTGGFISKWLLIQSVLEDSRMVWLAVLILASSLLAIIYVWRAVECLYLRPAPKGRGEVAEAPLVLLLPTWLLALANVWFGLDARLPIEVARSAASGLLGGFW